MISRRKWSRKATAASVGLALLGGGTVAAQSMEPWWISTDLAPAAVVSVQNGAVAINSSGGLFSGSIARAKSKFDTTGEYIGCNVTSFGDNGQFINCAARNAQGQTASCESVFLGSTLTFAQTAMLSAAMNINADSYVLVSHNGGNCQSITVSNTSANFLVNEGGVASCNAGNSVDIGAFSGSAVSVPNNGCAKVTKFAKPYFPYGPGRTMQLQNPSGTTSYPLSYEYSQSCTGAYGAGSFTAVWNDQFLPGISDACTLYIKFFGNGSGSISLKYF